MEFAAALELHRCGRVRLVPVIVRNCYWQNLPLARLNVLPDAGRPVTGWATVGCTNDLGQVLLI